MKHTVVAIIVTGLSAFAGVVFFLLNGASLAKDLDRDIYGLTYQFLLIIVLGGLVSLLYRQFTIDRETREDRRTRLRELHSDLLSAYNQAKKARRLLRARAVSVVSSALAEPTVLASEYNAQMLQIIDAQLTFETYLKRSRAKALFDSVPNLENNLKKVESYLNNTIDEFEGKFREFQGEPKVKPLAELPCLGEFIGPYKESNGFKHDFKYPFQDALDALGDVLLTEKKCDDHLTLAMNGSSVTLSLHRSTSNNR